MFSGKLRYSIYNLNIFERERLVSYMKLRESASLEIEKSEKISLLSRILSDNAFRNRMLALFTTELIVILLLANMSTLLMNVGKHINFNDYTRLYLLVIFSLFSWVASKIIYKNYCNGFKTKARLASEIEKNRIINEELKRANEELKELSFTDELTKIPNRRSFSNYLDFAYKHNLKRNSMISIIMIDIDHFKNYNDTLGHNQANKVLIEVAEIINSVCRNSNDHAARYGGDEFIFASLNTNEAEIIELSEVIRSKVKELRIPNNVLNNKGIISLSLGTSTIKVVTKEDIYRSIELADKALYAAKASGRDCVRSISEISNKQDIEYMKLQAN